MISNSPKVEFKDCYLMWNPIHLFNIQQYQNNVLTGGLSTIQDQWIQFEILKKLIITLQWFKEMLIV